MTSSIDPLADLLRQFPFQGLIAVTGLSLFGVWWVAVRRQKRRLTAMRMQLDELRGNVRSLEADYGSLLARFLNLSGSPKSPTVTDRTDPPVVPEKPEIGLHERRYVRTIAKREAAD